MRVAAFTKSASTKKYEENPFCLITSNSKSTRSLITPSYVNPLVGSPSNTFCRKTSSYVFPSGIGYSGNRQGESSISISTKSATTAVLATASGKSANFSQAVFWLINDQFPSIFIPSLPVLILRSVSCASASSVHK